MGSFVALRGSEGWLQAISKLDPERAAVAERLADQWVRQEFADWDQTAWSVGQQPTDVEDGAAMVAAAEYLDLSAISADSQAEEDSRSAVLRKRAQHLAASARGRGFMLRSDGSREEPIQKPRSLTARWGR